jgi:hypothetical protein
MKCDFCNKPAVAMTGESNGVLACADHAKKVSVEKGAAELDAIRHAAYAGHSNRSPEADVRFLLRLLDDTREQLARARGERPSGFWSQREWEDWSNELALLIPEEYEDDVAQEAIIQRALADLVTRVLPSADGRTVRGDGS